MRLLILLSAMLTALCGVVSGAGAAASQVEASISIGQQATPAAAEYAARFIDDEAPRASPLWHVAAPAVRVWSQPLYADRRRE